MSRQSKLVFAAVSAIAAATILAGCATARPESLAALKDSRLASELRANLDAIRPRSFRAVHRAVLTIRGRQFAFTGYVRGNNAGDIRLQATGDFGGTVFVVELLAHGRTRVLANATPLRDSWLECGAARDLEVLYRLRPSPAAQLVRFAGGTVGFRDRLPDGSTAEFKFAADSHRFGRYRILKYRRRMYEALVLDAGSLGAERAALPARVAVRDYQLGYSLDVRVVQMRPADGG